MFRRRLGQAIFIAVAVSAGTATDAATLVDPTRPQRGDESTTPVLRLESVLIGATRRIAVINGNSLTVGDRIGSAELLRIEAGKVWLRSAGDTVVLQLVVPTIRTRVEQER